MRRLLPLALCCGVVLLVLAPVLADPAGRALGLRYVDGFGTQWWFWYLGEVLAGREDLTHTTLLFYPTGKEVFGHTGGNLFDALCAWPLRRLFGDAAGYNLWIAVLLASNFAGGSVLGRAFSDRPGWLGGLVLALNPFVLQELAGGRPTQAWLAFPALALAGTWRAERVRTAVGTGIAVALSGWTYWYAGVLVGVLALGVGLARIVLRPERLRSAALLGLAAGVAGLLVAPALVMVGEALDGGRVPGLLAVDGTGVLAPLALRTVEGDAAGLYVLAPLKGVSGSVTGDPEPTFAAAFPTMSFAALGASVLAAAFAARARAWVSLAVAVAVFVVAALVASGPIVAWGDGWVVNRPWVEAVSRLQVLRRWWWPGRAVVGVYLAFAMAVPWLGSWRWRGWAPLPLLAAVGVGVEVWRTEQLPLPTWDAHVPGPLRCLRAAPDGAVIDLPFLSDQRNLWFQTHHGHPLLSGMMVRNPQFGSASAVALRADNGLLDLLLDYGELQLTRDPTFDEADRAALIAAGFRYVVVDLTRLEGTHVGRADSVFGKSLWPRVKRLLRPVLGEPAAEAEGVALYTLDGTPLECGGLGAVP